MPVRRAVLPEVLRGSEVARVLEARGGELTFVAPGHELEPLEGLRVRAPDLPGAPANEQSLWARVDAGGTAVLLPGDAGPRSIRDVLRHPGVASAVDVLVLPHHGRGEAADAARLLDTLAPAACVASSSSAPDTPLAAVVRQRGTPLLTTAEHGTLRIRLDPLRIDAEHPARWTPCAR